MLTPSAALTSIGLEFVREHPKRRACSAAIAVGAVGKHAASSKASADQFRIGCVVNQVTGCRDLRPGKSVGQIAARVGCSCIKLQRLERKFI